MKTHIAAYPQIYRFTKKPTGNTVAQCGDVVTAFRLASKKKATCEVCQRRVRKSRGNKAPAKGRDDAEVLRKANNRDDTQECYLFNLWTMVPPPALLRALGLDSGRKALESGGGKAPA